MQISSSAIIRHIYRDIFDVHQCALSLSKNKVLLLLIMLCNCPSWSIVCSGLIECIVFFFPINKSIFALPLF